MVVIDGSFGEGGGQIVRTAVGLSAYFGQPCEVINIRKGRPNPGLRAQHVAGVKAVLKMCGGRAEGLREGSDRLVFFPGAIRGGNFDIDVGTAGAIGLVLQTIMLPCVKLTSRLLLRIKGGTDVKWAPPAFYIKEVLIPTLKNMGYKGDLEVKKRGYYPQGGGEVLFWAEGSELRGIHVHERGEVLKVIGVSHASKPLEKRRVAERQREAAFKLLQEEGIQADIYVKYYDTPSLGSGIDLVALCQKSILGSNAIGEKGKRAEEVGREAAEKLLRALSTEAAFDPHLGDQLLPFLAIAKGPSSITVSENTGHIMTNIWVISHFAGCRHLRIHQQGKRCLIEAL